MKVSFTSKGMALLISSLVFACQPDLETVNDQSMAVSPETSSSSFISNQYIIVFNQQKTGNARALFSDTKQARKFVENKGVEIVSRVAPDFSQKQISQVFSASINGISAKLTAEQAEALQGDESVALIEQDQIITLAPKKPGGGGGSTAEEIPYGIERVNGGTTYSGSHVAWIIDSGVDLNHPDLNVNTNLSRTFISRGRDSKSADDLNGHGSHVAGTIAAIDNEIGVVGVAAGATVVAVKVLDAQGSGSYSGVIAGVDYVAANGSSGDVANMSLGGPVSEALDNAVIEAAASSGVKFVLAAGNESDDANSHSPARANGQNVYTISAMDENDEWAYFSNYGNPPIDFCAPGVAIKSTYKDGGYATLSGTSMAAPHAAGVLLLGNASTSGTVMNDPDDNPDSIIVH